jgi:uncharacterized RDD family membrane protein YckC
MSASPWETVPPPATEAPRAGNAAKWWNRVGATIFDNVLVAIPTWIVIAILGIAKFGSLGGNVIVGFVAFVYAVLMLAYRDGQTVGKQVASVRVVTEDDGPVGLGRAFGRELLKFVFAYTVLIYLIDVLWPLWQPQNRALHDLAAGTRVVRTHGGDPPPARYYDANEEAAPQQEAAPPA